MTEKEQLILELEKKAEEIYLLRKQNIDILLKVNLMKIHSSPSEWYNRTSELKLKYQCEANIDKLQDEFGNGIAELKTLEVMESKNLQPQ